MLSAQDRAALLDAGNRYSTGDLDKAESIARRVLKRNRSATDAIQLLGLIAFQRKDYDEAASCYRKCLKLAPDNPLYHYLLGKVFTIRGDLDRAIATFDKALACKDDYQPAISWKAVVLERRGDLDAARDLARPIVEAGREDAEMAETWARLEIAADHFDTAVAVIDRQLAHADLPQLSRETFGFLKARAFENAGKHEAAFAAYAEANSNLNASFDPGQHLAMIEGRITFYTPERLATLCRGGDATPLPVFIAGMPRSGTTLVEQIIDTAEGAYGPGEIDDLERIATSLQAVKKKATPYPGCLAELSQRAVDHHAETYLTAIRAMSPAASIITNKHLDNYRQLGLIAQLLPGARIIHVRRDPMDTCLSCYFSHLMPIRLGYACNLQHLGDVYCQYDRLMKHWAAVLDIRILTVQYEQLVQEQERVSREIIDFCGLEWDERCLDFHRSGRFAMTLSYDQVRQPIYDSSIGRYRHYERQLAPLREALAPVLP